MLAKPGRGEGLPISLPLDGWGWEALSATGQPDPLAGVGIHHPRLAVVQAQPAEQAPHCPEGAPAAAPPILIHAWGQDLCTSLMGPSSSLT